MNTDLSCSEELETGQEQVGEVSSRVFISGGRERVSLERCPLMGAVGEIEGKQVGLVLKRSRGYLSSISGEGQGNG
jgi:hypothetical protein